jgi:hypothetical protein
MQGEFSIIKGYGGVVANMFSVSNAHKPKNQDFYVYTVAVRYYFP